MTQQERPRGVKVFPMPEEICGYDDYALAVNENLPHEVRMVHTEGVAYAVRDDKPWTWNDYGPCQEFTREDLLIAAEGQTPVDLADWVRSFGRRLEENFYLVRHWATKAE
jgi:hypothetical protein